MRFIELTLANLATLRSPSAVINFFAGLILDQKGQYTGSFYNLSFDRNKYCKISHICIIGDAGDTP